MRILLSAVLLLAACTSPAPAPPAPPPFPIHDVAPIPAPVDMQDAALLCHPGVRVLPWAALRVPEGYRPIDLALARDTAWVLFDPSALASVPRSGAEPVRTFGSRYPEEAWRSIDADPLDGSLWIAVATAYRLIRLTPEGAEHRIELSGVSGEGGLRQVRVGRERIYGVPVCADDAVWIFDRRGKLLGSSFTASERLADVDTERAVNLGFACPTAFLGRDVGGRVVALNPEDVTLYRETDRLDWEPIGGPYELEPPGRHTANADLRVAALDAAGRASYLRDIVQSLFFRGGTTLLLGSGIWEEQRGHRRTLGTILFREENGVLRPLLEACDGKVIVAVESDAEGYAVATAEGLVLGSFAGPGQVGEGPR